jgi:hypothetical protein
LTAEISAPTFILRLHLELREQINEIPLPYFDDLRVDRYNFRFNPSKLIMMYNCYSRLDVFTI